MNTKFNFLFIISVIFIVSIVSADMGYTNPNLPQLKAPVVTTIAYNNDTANVNNSLYWQGHTGTDGSWLTGIMSNTSLNTSQFTYGSSLWNLNLTTIGNYVSGLYCKLTGCTMTGNIEMSNNNITNVGFVNNINSTAYQVGTTSEVEDRSYNCSDGTCVNAPVSINNSITILGNLTATNMTATYFCNNTGSCWNTANSGISWATAMNGTLFQTNNFNVTNSSYAQYQFTNNNFNGSGNFNTSIGNITTQNGTIGVGTPATAVVGVNVAFTSNNNNVIGGSFTPTSNGSSLTGLSGTAISKRDGSATTVTGLSFTGVWSPPSLTANRVMNTMTGSTITIQAINPPSSANNMTVTNMIGSTYGTQLISTTGVTTTATNIYGFKSSPVTLVNGGGTASATNQYAFYDTGMTGATNNWGFYGLSSQNYLSGNLTVGNTITTSNASSYTNQVVCYLAGGTLGHCTSVVGITGSCTCVAN